MGNVENNQEVSQGTLMTIDQEYERISKSKSLDKPLTLSQVLLAKTPENHPFSFSHIAVLFVCDKEHDGVFSRKDMIHLALWIQQHLQGVQSFELKAQLQTEALDTLIKFILTPEGEKQVILWVISMLVKDSAKVRHENHMKVQQLKLLYDIFNVKTMSNIDFQYFNNVIRRSSEQMNHQIFEVYEGEELQEYISITIIHHFVKMFLKGIKKIVRQIGFDTNIT